MTKLSVTVPLPPRLLSEVGAESARRLGELFFVNAIQIGLRRDDGVKYVPITESALPAWGSSHELRARLRQEYLAFFELLLVHPSASEFPLEEWRELGGHPALWTDPLLSALWASRLLPSRFDVRITAAVNQLRVGEAGPALESLQEELARAPRRREARAQLLRNAAAAYEVLGDDEGAHWCAQAALAACPWNYTSLLTQVIYAVLDPASRDGSRQVARSCRGFRGPLDRHRLWSALRTRGGRASDRLRSDPDLQSRMAQAIFS